MFYFKKALPQLKADFLQLQKEFWNFFLEVWRKMLIIYWSAR